MQTIKTISNISYNSLPFFESKIFDLVKRGIIDWAYWVCHVADTDETKDHIHFVLKPSKRLDTFQLKNEFNELDPLKPSKPLSVTSKWNYTNSMEDWLLYAVHDEAYLASKGQRRNVHYAFEDLKSTDEDALRADWNNIDFVKFSRMNRLANAVNKHIPFAVLVQQGVIPIAMRAQYECQYNALVHLDMMNESGRYESHEPVVDDDGVIIDGFIADDQIQF